MTTKFSVGDEVYIRAVVTGIGIDSTGTKYRVDLPNIDPAYKPSMTISEENLISADVEDFRRENMDGWEQAHKTRVDGVTSTPVVAQSKADTTEN